MLHLYYVFYNLNFFSWYLLVYYAIFCPTLNKDFSDNNNNNNNNNNKRNSDE